MKVLILALWCFPWTFYGQKKSKDAHQVKEFEAAVEQEVLKRIDEIKKKSVVDMTKSLIEKQQQLEKRERLLAQEKEQIEKAKEELQKRIQNFEQKQTKVIGCMDNHEKKAKERISQMVTVISNMKPEKAAQLLSVQDADISVSILSEIDPTRASKIFNIMDKEISARLQKQYLNMKK